LLRNVVGNSGKLEILGITHLGREIAISKSRDCFVRRSLRSLASCWRIEERGWMSVLPNEAQGDGRGSFARVDSVPADDLQEENCCHCRGH